MWEDAQNKNGGRWLVNLNKNQRMTELDNFWLETVSLSVKPHHEKSKVVSKQA